MVMTNMRVLPLKPQTPAERATRTTVDTILVTRDLVTAWINPVFQRELRINQKVKDLAELMKTNGGVFPDVITLGKVAGKLYLLDGQHRRAAFLLSGLEEGYADVRTHHFGSMAEMGQEFVMVNSQLVRLRADDVIRALAMASEPLSTITHECNFVGYDMVRKGTERTQVITMAALLRAWRASALQSPAQPGTNAADLAASITGEDAAQLVPFLHECDAGWGRDPAYARLWGMLNLTLCMWLYRRLVLQKYSHKVAMISLPVFGKCIAAVADNKSYIDWLKGRTSLKDSDRSPAYARVKAIFARCLERQPSTRKQLLPDPDWAGG